jgi:hypothetical protein
MKINRKDLPVFVSKDKEIKTNGDFNCHSYTKMMVLERVFQNSVIFVLKKRSTIIIVCFARSAFGEKKIKACILNNSFSGFI